MKIVCSGCGKTLKEGDGSVGSGHCAPCGRRELVEAGLKEVADRLFPEGGKQEWRLTDGTQVVDVFQLTEKQAARAAKLTRTFTDGKWYLEKAEKEICGTV